MKVELNFQEACRVLAGENRQDLTDAGDKLSAFILLLITATSAALRMEKVLESALSVFDARSEAFRLLSAVKGAAGSQHMEGLSHDQVADRILASHVITVYASWFDAIEELCQGLELSADQRALPTLQDIQETLGRDLLAPLDEVGLPHPADTFLVATADVHALHTRLTEGLHSLARERLSRLDAGRREAVEDALKKLPSLAAQIWQKQAVTLAGRFSCYGAWLNLSLHERAEKQVKKTLRATDDISARLDIGLASLERRLDDIATMAARPSATEARQGLVKLGERYRSILDRPVLRPDDVSDTDDSDPLVLPKVRDIFVPQPFQVLRRRGDTRLDRTETWGALEVRDDLVDWIVSWLSSPHSARAPLVILGMPGSGKTLLTRVLAARLSEGAARPIRVELRGVAVNPSVRGQICEAVQQDLGRELSWGAQLEAMGSAGCVLILDGYDELVQVGGEQHHGYIENVRAFQDDPTGVPGETPIRAIVTSRLTLIERCKVPKDAAVLRLLPFDAARQDRWAKIWNTTNHTWMRARGVTPFRVPRDAPSVVELASQPLLLLLLAVYDADKNALQREILLDRPALYDRIIRRFVKRELSKDPSYQQLDARSQIQREERQIERLGIAALGMFNRGGLSIHEEELSADLRWHGLVDDRAAQGAEADSPGGYLLRGFFFVHESKANVPAGQSGAKRAYEFLHQSFGEFLVADRVCRLLLKTVADLAHHRDRAGEAYSHDDDDRSPLAGSWQEKGAQKWHMVLGYRPMFRSVETLKMAQTWLGALADSKRIDRNTLPQLVSEILEYQLRHALDDQQWPGRYPDAVGQHALRPLPLMGHIATATLNLATLRVVLGTAPWVLGGDWNHEASGMGAWARLSHLWRCWYPLVELDGLSRAFKAEAGSPGDTVVTCQLSADAVESTSTFDRYYAASSAIGDGLTFGLLSYFRGPVGQDRSNNIQQGWSTLRHLLPELEVAYRAGIIRQQSMSEAQPANRVLALLGSGDPHRGLSELMQREGRASLIDAGRILRDAPDAHHLFTYHDIHRTLRAFIGTSGSAVEADLAASARELGDSDPREWYLYQHVHMMRETADNPKVVSDRNLATMLRLAREIDHGGHLTYLLTIADERAARIGNSRWWVAQDERLLSILWLRGPVAFLRSLASSARRQIEDWPIELMRAVTQVLPFAPPELQGFAQDHAHEVGRIVSEHFRGFSDGRPGSVLLPCIISRVVRADLPEVLGPLEGWSWQSLYELRQFLAREMEVPNVSLLEEIDSELARRETATGGTPGSLRIARRLRRAARAPRPKNE